MKQGKKISHFILEMGFGGAENLVRILSQKLELEGYDNEVLCFDGIEDYPSEFEESGVPLNLLKRNQRFLDIPLINPLIKRIKRKKIKLIHAHDIASLSYAVVAGRICGAKVIMTEHSRHYIDAKIRRKLEKWCLVMASQRLIEVSPELRKASIQIDKIPANHIEVIENGIDVKRFENATPIPLHTELGIPQGKKLILVAGRLETIKGQHHLIKALSTPMLRRRNLHALFAGHGSSMPAFRQLAAELNVADRVHFLGTRHDIPKLMATCDLLALPSESEGLPFVLLEAMAAGIPIIASRVGRVPNLIGKNERGFLVAPGDPGALAEAILFSMGNENSLQNKAEAGRKFVKKYYSQERMLKNYRNIYLKVLG